jgi:hypothetical protein
MANSSERDKLEQDKRLMGALLRMPPKPHAEMKLGKPKRKIAKNRPSKQKAR